MAVSIPDQIRVPLIASAIYLVGFLFLYRWIGDAIVALSAVPIIAFGHAYGRRAGVGTGVVVCGLNYLIFDAFGRWPGEISPGLPMLFASIVLIGLGLLAGFFGEARATVEREVVLRKATEEKLRAALAEVHALRGLVPICSNCKKIRGEDDAWVPVERFIQERSETSFTHGICPTCTDELYPD